jgi:hypothetical protein
MYAEGLCGGRGAKEGVWLENQYEQRVGNIGSDVYLSCQIDDGWE